MKKYVFSLLLIIQWVLLWLLLWSWWFFLEDITSSIIIGRLQNDSFVRDLIWDEAKLNCHWYSSWDRRWSLDNIMCRVEWGENSGNEVEIQWNFWLFWIDVWIISHKNDIEKTYTTVYQKDGYVSRWWYSWSDMSSFVGGETDRDVRNEFLPILYAWNLVEKEIVYEREWLMYEWATWTATYSSWNLVKIDIYDSLWDWFDRSTLIYVEDSSPRYLEERIYDWEDLFSLRKRVLRNNWVIYTHDQVYEARWGYSFSWNEYFSLKEVMSVVFEFDEL